MIDNESQPANKAPPPPVVGPEYNEEGAAETLAWQKHQERQRRPYVKFEDYVAPPIEERPDPMVEIIKRWEKKQRGE